MSQAYRGLLLAIALLAGPSAALGQRGDPGDKAVVEVLELREKLRALIVARDRVALDRLYDPNFVHLRDSGRTDLKAERMKLVLSGEQTIETGAEEGVSVQFFEPSTAIATGVTRIRDPGTGRPTPFRWLVVYAKSEAGWRVAASQASRLTGKAR